MPALGGCSGAGILIVKLMFLDFDRQNTHSTRGIQIYSTTVFVRFTHPGTGKTPAKSSYSANTFLSSLCFAQDNHGFTWAAACRMGSSSVQFSWLSTVGKSDPAIPVQRCLILASTFRDCYRTF